MNLGDGYFIHHIEREKPAMGFRVDYCWDNKPIEHEGQLYDTWHERAWCCEVELIDTAGKWMLAEHLFTNYKLPLRVRHEGVSRMVPFIEATCLAHGKQLMICTSSKGLVRGLERMNVARDSGLKVLLGVRQ